MYVGEVRGTLDEMFGDGELGRGVMAEGGRAMRVRGELRKIGDFVADIGIF